MVKLFSEFNLKSIKIKNRIVMAPMCMYSADDGYANEWHYTHYTTRAVGGVGLIILEATGVESRGRISDRDLGLWKDEHIEGLKKIVDGCRKYGAKIGVQLGHAGRKSRVLSEMCIAPSSIAFSEESRVPQKMHIEDIKKVIASFRDAARRADMAGFDFIELHGAHGYLISEFISPLTNHREDEYGGNVENRARFLKEVLREVKIVWPDEKPIIVRVSADDLSEGGNCDRDVAAILNCVKGYGIDLVNVSSGGVVNKKVEAYPGYQIRYAETIKKEADIPVIAGGLITSPLMAEEILKNERADFVFLGRELLRNPYWPLHAASLLGGDIQWPVQYERAK